MAPAAGPAPIIPPLPRGFGGWQRTWLAVPEATSFAAGSCERGLLHADAALRAEVVDGQLVLASRSARGAPFATGIAARAARLRVRRGRTRSSSERGDVTW